MTDVKRTEGAEPSGEGIEKEGRQDAEAPKQVLRTGPSKVTDAQHYHIDDLQAQRDRLEARIETFESELRTLDREHASCVREVGDLRKRLKGRSIAEVSGVVMMGIGGGFPSIFDFDDWWRGASLTLLIVGAVMMLAYTIIGFIVAD